jgi:polyisoprenoid-binding protein YceI
MRAPSAQMTAPALQALLKEGALAGEWALDPRTSGIRLKTKIMALVPVNGVFREVSGTGTVSADGEVSGILTVAAASIDTKNTRRDTWACPGVSGLRILIGSSPERTGSRVREIPEVYSRVP